MILKRRKKAFTSALSALLGISMMFTACGNGSSSSAGSGDSSAASQTDSGGDSKVQTNDDGSLNKDLTSLELVKIMGNGINLGNTMEAYTHSHGKEDIFPDESEQAWGQPITTQEMITGMKDCGFDSLRVPVAWTNAMSFYEDGNYDIDKAYLDRVEEIVNYAINADMYVIINDHWDGGWWGRFGAEDEAMRTAAMEMYKSMWTQIAERFKDYSDKLIFESANEELGDRLNDEIDGKKGKLKKTECYEKTNEINQTFVDLIRSTGGNNEQRFLLIAGYNTDITMTCDDKFKMPTDTAKDKLLLSVHYYTPWDYCGTDGVNSWGSVKDYEEQNELMKKLSKFTEAGYGVVIGEYAVLTNSSEPKNDTDKFYTDFLANCDLYNFCPMLWDCNNLYQRRDCDMPNADMKNLFLEKSYAKQKDMSDDDIKKNAQKIIDDAYAAAQGQLTDSGVLMPDDNKAIAWIMYQSNDYSKTYSVGDEYDPTSATAGLEATNAEITGSGEYTVKLDFTGCGAAKGVAFSALGISNGEDLFPKNTITINKVLINGNEYTLDTGYYTASDDGSCTRVNLYNAWVNELPDDIRGATENATAVPMPLKKSDLVNTIEIQFTFNEAA
ncbi:glycoside hydrolase family 5 protein [Ruminococcus sp. NK3A76]|uniref:glycoside hydrolase family 5 protein n=1 Tax=Ruminococcus sp. NK3A76 TaxID=877411 RepID=UPI0006910D8B|nr:glycoside hydrolase family 5 protein [Ruminococcus sp. NK3A76]